MAKSKKNKKSKQPKITKWIDPSVITDPVKRVEAINKLKNQRNRKKVAEEGDYITVRLILKDGTVKKWEVVV